MSLQQSIVAYVDADLEDLVPGFLAHCKDAIPGIENALARGDIRAVRALGHRLKGTGGGYGFDRITEIGAAIEELPESSSAAEVRPLLVELAHFVDTVEIVYV